MHTKNRFLRTFVCLVLAAGLVLPSVAGATTVADTNYENYTVDQLETLIKRLQTRLTELRQAQKCFISEKELSLGDGEAGESTDDVRQLQDFLTEKGHFKYKSTGYFGKITFGALMAFQKSQGLPATGTLDQATREKAHAMACTKAIARKLKKEVREQKQEEKKTEKATVSVIILKAEGSKVMWRADGKSAQGFKVVWSKSSGPTYPNRDSDRYQYLSEPSANGATLDAFDGSGTYYVRVCEYLGGSCGVYSNEVQVQL